MAINYLIIPINSLKCEEEKIECGISKLQGFLEKRFLQSCFCRSQIFVENGGDLISAMCVSLHNSYVSSAGSPSWMSLMVEVEALPTYDGMRISFKGT